MSAAELRRRSVLAAQRPLQEEPGAEAGLQDGAAAEPDVVDIDAEKDGEAEEVVAIDEESREAVAEPAKGDFENVTAASTASARQASDPGINIAEVTFVCANLVGADISRWAQHGLFC